MIFTISMNIVIYGCPVCNQPKVTGAVRIGCHTLCYKSILLRLSLRQKRRQTVHTQKNGGTVV